MIGTYHHIFNHYNQTIFFLSPKYCGKTLQISLIKSQCKVALFNKFAIARYMTIITAGCASSLSKISMLAWTSDFVEKVGYCLLFPVMMLKTRIHWLRAANQPKSFPQGGCFLSHHDDHDKDDDDRLLRCYRTRRHGICPKFYTGGFSG